MAAASISGRTAVAILPLAPKAEGWFQTGLARAYPRAASIDRLPR